MTLLLVVDTGATGAAGGFGLLGAIGLLADLAALRAVVFAAAGLATGIAFGATFATFLVGGTGVLGAAATVRLGLTAALLGTFNVPTAAFAGELLVAVDLAEAVLAAVLAEAFFLDAAAGAGLLGVLRLPSALTMALTNSSFFMACQPDTPFFLASAARSFEDRLLRFAAVINVRTLRSSQRKETEGLSRTADLDGIRESGVNCVHP